MTRMFSGRTAELRMFCVGVVWLLALRSGGCGKSCLYVLILFLFSGKKRVKRLRKEQGENCGSDIVILDKFTFAVKKKSIQVCGKLVNSMVTCFL